MVHCYEKFKPGRITIDKIEKPINNLNSSNRNTRYEACEELRVADNLPESAITALEAATTDPAPQVADAAKRALAIHRLPPSSDVILNDVQEREKSMAQTKGKARNMLLIRLPIFIVCGGIAGGLLFFLW